MKEETKEKLGKALDAIKHYAWKFFGAMFMETKDGEPAVSFTRVVAATLFIMLVWKWSGLSAHPEVPEYMIYTFWGLIGIKSALNAADKFTGPGPTPGAPNA